MLKLEKRLTRPHQKEKTFTLADVRDAVKNSTTLKGTRIRDLTSAVSSFCGLIGRDANAVPLDLGAIRQELGAINPAAAGISAKRLANIRSDLLAAITASGLKALKRPPKKLTEPWSDLRKKLKTRGHQFGLSRFCHYASAEGIAPTDVDDAHVAAFMVWVHENAFHRNPNELHRQTAMIWNTVAAEHTELGLKFVTLPSFRVPPRRLDLALLPDSFRDDVKEYLAWCACTDEFAADARTRRLAPGTLKLRRAQIHAAVTALVERGVEVLEITKLATLVTPDHFTNIARRRRDMADGTKNAFNKQLVKALVQIAREWVKVDGVTLTELKRLAGKVPEPRGDLTQKNKRFLRQFDDPATLQRLRALPEKLWSRVRRDGAPSYRTLAVAQAALAQEILTYMPLRIQNLAALTFDEHLFLSYGREAVSSLEISAEEVKNEQFIAFDLPPHIARMLMEYRDEIAPNIIGRKPDRLFVNSDGTAKLPQTLSKLIQRVIGKETGIEISAHQFRHLAAKIILDHSPGAFELVKQLLGHQSLKTTVNSYSGIDTRRAARHHHQLLEKWSEEHAHDLRPSGAKRRFKSKTSKKKH
jgi:integrase